MITLELVRCITFKLQKSDVTQDTYSNDVYYRLSDDQNSHLTFQTLNPRSQPHFCWSVTSERLAFPRCQSHVGSEWQPAPETEGGPPAPSPEITR